MNEIQEYLNRVGWSTITVLAEKFDMSRYNVVTAIVEMRNDQEVRVYDEEIVHV